MCVETKLIFISASFASWLLMIIIIVIIVITASVTSPLIVVVVVVVSSERIEVSCDLAVLLAFRQPLLTRKHRVLARLRVSDLDSVQEPVLVRQNSNYPSRKL